MNSHSDFPQLKSSVIVCLIFQHWFFFSSHARTLCAFVYLFIYFPLFLPIHSTTGFNHFNVPPKVPCLIGIDFQRSIRFSSTNPLAPQVFQQTIFPFFFCFSDLTTFVAFAPGERQQTQPCERWFFPPLHSRHAGQYVWLPACTPWPQSHSCCCPSLLPPPVSRNQTAQKAQSQFCSDGTLNRKCKKKKKKKRTSVIRIQGQTGLTGL